jgi:hypothetical protein
MRDVNHFLSFPVYYKNIQIPLDVEWLLSTLFDASLFSLSKPPSGGFFSFPLLPPGRKAAQTPVVQRRLTPAVRVNFVLRDTFFLNGVTFAR